MRVLALALDRRAMRKWYRACCAFPGGGDIPAELEEVGIAVLPTMLAQIDPRAARLTAEQIRRAYAWRSRPRATAAAFAARLACDCGAFEYGQSRDERKKAKTAFRVFSRPK